MISIKNLKEKLEAYKPMLLKKYNINQLGIKVHIFTKNGLKGQRKARILSEVVYI